MLPERFNDVHWTWLVYVEMFVAGVAAGAYVAATILEVSGRGRSTPARTAHLMAFPLMALAGLLLTVDLSRPERFWHMIVQAERGLPMLKPWSPMSLGSWLLLLFSGVSFVSFVDALLALRARRRGYERGLHGSPLGLVWSVAGAGLALGVAIYSGVLLSTTTFPGWSHLSMIPAVYVATALITGVAAVVLVQAIGGQIDVDTLGLDRTNLWLIGWWLVTVVVFLLALIGRPDAGAYLRGPSLWAILAAILLAGILPLVLHALRPLSLSGRLALSAVVVLVGGLLVRFGIVMAPQLH